jgi:site-specific recombinase XerD
MIKRYEVEEIEPYDARKQLALGLRAVKKSKMMECNKEHILRYVDYLFVKDIGVTRITKCVSNLKMIAQWMKSDFKKATKEDLYRIVRIINERDSSDWTRYGYKVILRKFYQWLYGYQETKKFPDIVNWIEAKKKLCNKKLISSEGLLEEIEIIKLVETSDNIRDKAFIYLLWESGARIGEIARLRIKNLKFDEVGALLYIEKGKTGGRTIRIVNSASYIAAWLSTHPRRNEKEAPLWVNQTCKRKGRALKYPSFSILLRRAFQKAGIDKRSNPHFFRHSRATEMANHLTEFQMNQFFGWKQGSEMPSIYVHLSGKNTDDAVLKMHGLEKKEEVVNVKPSRCKNCNSLNPPGKERCMKCGNELNEKETEKDNTSEKEMIFEKLLNDKEFCKLLKARLEKSQLY